MSSVLKHHFTTNVTEMIPLGKQRRPSSEETSLPVLGRHSEKAVKNTHSLPKHSVVEQRVQRPVAHANMKSSWSKFQSCKVVAERIQPHKLLTVPNKNDFPNSTATKVISPKTATYTMNREDCLAFSRMLNENLRVNSSLGRQRPALPPSSHTTHNPNRMTSDGSNSKGQKKDNKHNQLFTKDLDAPQSNPIPEGRLSHSTKRKREASIEGGRKQQHCHVNQLNSSSFSINAFDKKTLLKSSISMSVGSLKENQFSKNLTSTADKTKPSPLSFYPRQNSSVDSKSKKPNLLRLTKSIKTVGAIVEQTSRTTEPLPHRVSNTSDVSDELSGPDLNSSSHMPETSSASSHKDSVTRSSTHKDDINSPTFEEQASSCKMGVNEGMLKVEQSRSPKANLSGTSLKADASKQQKCSDNRKDSLLLRLGEDNSGDEMSEQSSSDEDGLPSFSDIMEFSASVTLSPDKSDFSEPKPAISKPEAVKPTSVISNNYKNTLDLMLKEKEKDLRLKDLEKRVLESEGEIQTINADKENRTSDDDISAENREMLQKFSVSFCTFKDIHPGEEVFVSSMFGRLFSQQMLDQKINSVIPRNISHQTVVSAEQVLYLGSSGTFSKAYVSFLRQPEVTQWGFQMMSIHTDPVISTQLLRFLKASALSAAQHIVENRPQRFKVWVPSIQDITVVFLNLGASFISLFPLKALQPTFTERDLLEVFLTNHDRIVLDNKTIPQHNWENVLEYLYISSALCPRSYTDQELLLLLTMMCRTALEIQFKKWPIGRISMLLDIFLKNVLNWKEQMLNVCQALADLSEDHHNLRRLVKILPDSQRGKLLKQHLSVLIIAKLLDQTYRPSGIEFKLSVLKTFLPQMRPSSLLKRLPSGRKKMDCDATLDKQAYYLCYSLLEMINVASSYDVLPSNQKTDLQILSSQLEKHIKCDIRESEKMLYRSNVKDFVARIYTKWQLLLVRTRPCKGNLFDYWKPPPEDEVSKSPQHTSCVRLEDKTDRTETHQLTPSSSKDAENREEPNVCEESLEGEEQNSLCTEENMEDSHNVEVESDKRGKEFINKDATMEIPDFLGSCVGP